MLYVHTVRAKSSSGWLLVSLIDRIEVGLSLCVGSVIDEVGEK